LEAEKDETSKNLDEENPPQYNHRFLNSRQRVKATSMTDGENFGEREEAEGQRNNLRSN